MKHYWKANLTGSWHSQGLKIYHAHQNEMLFEWTDCWEEGASAGWSLATGCGGGVGVGEGVAARGSKASSSSSSSSSVGLSVDVICDRSQLAAISISRASLLLEAWLMDARVFGMKGPLDDWLMSTGKESGRWHLLNDLSQSLTIYLPYSGVSI